MSRKVSTTLSNESEVEQKILFPLLVDHNFLAIPKDAVKPKEYMAPTQLDKAAGRNSGYYPDFSIWFHGQPTLIVEAKDPTVRPEVGFREASLYARHLNSHYTTGLNPCHFIMASNGIEILAGYWDQESPELRFSIDVLGIGSAALETLIKFCGNSPLENHAKKIFKALRIDRGTHPYQLAGGQPLINAKQPLNSFAADLSPVLRRYFSSTDEGNSKEIAERAYVSSIETTEYDRILEALLRDRVSPRRDTIVKSIVTTKKEEPHLTEAIREYSEGSRTSGQLQIIQGGVGSGKSLFARRYRDLLEPDDLRERSIWAFINFNNSPPTLKAAERWLCEAFLENITLENPALDLYSEPVLKGAFSKHIQQNRARYELLRKASEADELRARAGDIGEWQKDSILFAEGLAQYIVGGTNRNLIVVMDNVDKMDLQNQLDAFQLSLWFMAKTKAFIILQMRDETYERFKNSPPLDTFRSGITFHIAPPRFIDVVKKRLELGISYLADHASEKQEYILDNNMRVQLPKGELGRFLLTLYTIIFGRRGNVSRILEALAGRDVRKALEMFVSIVTSGHLSTSAITSNVMGEGSIPISEYHIIKILMRADYRFFSENTGNISNVFHYDLSWQRADNFLLSEILFYLSLYRKQRGELGLEGYFSVRRLIDELQKIGYEPDTTFRAINYLLNRQLIIADNFNFSSVEIDNCVKIQASGFMHLRVLCERLEYLHGVLPVTPIADKKMAALIGDYVNRENQRGHLSSRDKAHVIEHFQKFLKLEMARLHQKNPFFDEKKSGGIYVIREIERSLLRFWQADKHESDVNQLDLI